MTATTDFMNEAALGAPARTLDGARWVARVVQRFGGVVLILAAFGLWLQPGALWDADLMLFKFAISLVMGFAGLALIQSGRALPSAQVEIDTVRREVRLVRSGLRQAKRDRVIARTGFDALGSADMLGQMVRLWAQDGTLIAEVALSDPDTRRGLISALRDAGKL